MSADDPTDAWSSFRHARARMALDEFDAMPALAAAYALFQAEGDTQGSELTARTALIAIHYADATYVDLPMWIGRARWGEPPPADLDASTRAWWLAADMARTYVAATTEYRSPATLAARDALLQLIEVPTLDRDAFLIAVAMLLEYAEFEDDAVLFDRVFAEARPTLESDTSCPLYRSRAWHRVYRCAQSIGPPRRRGSQRLDAAEAEAQALALTERYDLRPLRAALLVGRAFYANLTGDEATAQTALLELGRITDFRRPLAAAWYYYVRGQAAARQEDAADALLQFGQAVAAATKGGAPIGVQQNFVGSYSMALLHDGRWAEARDHIDRLAAQQSGRDRAITECRREIAECQWIAAQSPAHAAAARVSVIARARDMRWVSFALLTPRSTARFLATALRDGASPEFIVQIVAHRKLSAEPDYPRTWP